MLEQGIIWKRWVDKLMAKVKFVDGNGKNNTNGGKYKVEATWNSTVYTKESKTEDHLSGLYYLVL